MKLEYQTLSDFRLERLTGSVEMLYVECSIGHTMVDVIAVARAGGIKTSEKCPRCSSVGDMYHTCSAW